MTCKYCKTTNRAHHTFCSKCGGNLYTKWEGSKKRNGLLNHLLLGAASRNPSSEHRHLYM